MRSSTTVLLILISALAYAQAEITQSNLPIIGDHVVIAICSGPASPGNAGAMQTWDMSGLTEDEEQFFTYINPSEGPLTDSFPNANLCARSWLDDFSYYNTSGSSLSVEGHVVTLESGDTAMVVFDNSELILELPYTYITGFVDDFDGDLFVPGFSGLTFEGTVEFEADGYGTLILPTGTYTNVVRYRMFREQNNSLNGFPAGTQTKEQWAWVSSEYRFWLLLMEENFDGTSTSSLVWYDKNPYSTSTSVQNLNQGQDIFAFPNPLRNGEALLIKWLSEEAAIVSLFREDGSLLDRSEIVLTPGTNKYNVLDVKSGVYVLKIETSNESFTQKVFVLD